VRGRSLRMAVLPLRRRVAPGSFDEVIDRVVERKRVLLAQCATCGPTYLQNLKPDASGDPAPVNDRYLSDASI